MRSGLAASLALVLTAPFMRVDAQEGSSPTLSVAISEAFGPHLVGPEGRPVYAMLTDRVTGDGQPPLDSCNASCREEWPVLTVPSEMAVGDALDPALAGTINWRGARVASFADHPLFLFQRDRPGEEPGGQGIYGFGGYWALLSPSGIPIRTGAMPEAG